MLTRRSRRTALAALALAAGLGVGAHAQDDEPDDSLRRPERLTVGVAEQLLGQLAPDGRSLTFVSDRNTINEIYVEDVEAGRARRLFDEGADVTWPRVSPDGKSLLYISSRDRATGQLCLRALPAGDERRCLEDEASALQAEWIDSSRIALVSRASIQGDLRVLEVGVGRRFSTRPLLDRNLTSPAISPDGRWMVYVPLERTVRQVGPAFAAQAAGRFEAVRLDRPDAPRPLAVDLPGLASQPAFARDGRHLYFVQFFSDSNHDGAIDANDHGVLFRVPFAPDRDDAPALAAAAMPEQLTDTAWNCQYPAPAADRLVATCSHRGGLDVYALPLDGEVPSDWSAERLAEEIELGGSRADELMLYRHRLAKTTGAIARRLMMVRLVRLHLDVDEFRAAEFYARHIAALEDPTTAGLSRPLLILVDHRRARRDRERGRLATGFEPATRERLEQLRPGRPASPAADVLEHVVRSEIADDLGDKTAARRELETTVIDERTPRSVIEVFSERADALYRELDDAPALAAVCRRLAALPVLTPPEQLEYARAAVRAMIRGLSFAEADARLAQARAGLAPDSELGFAVDLGRAVLGIRDDHPPAGVAESLLALHRQQTRSDRRRAVVLDAVRRAAEAGADRVIETLVEAHLADAKPGTSERRRAERLYRRAVVGRAYRRLAEGRRDEARADFEAVAERTASLESLVGALDLRLQQGEPPAALAALYHGDPAKPDPVGAFARAYLLARTLPALAGEAHAKAAADALATLKSAWPELRGKRAAQALFGAILHEEYLRTGDVAVAERADTHYLVALELVRTNPRYRAMILGQLGLLHLQVGNYRIALGYLEERETLPFPDNAAGLAVRLARARALLHVGREKEAAAAADQALAMLAGAPRLEAFRPLVVDRAALCHLAAGEFSRALALYDAELPLIATEAGPRAGRNRLVARLARAAAALGAKQPARALDDLAAVDQGLSDAAVTSELRWPHASPEHVLGSYRVIAAGLRANASRSLGQLDAARQALERRRTLFAETLARSDRDEDVRALTLAEIRLADNATERHDVAEAAKWLGAALDHADETLDRTHATVEVSELDALWFAGELAALLHAPLPFDVSDRLRRAYDAMVASHDRSWRTYRSWFEIYLALTEGATPGRSPPRPATPVATSGK